MNPKVMKIYKILLHALCLFFVFAACSNSDHPEPGKKPPAPKTTYNNVDGLVHDCADPYILKHDDIYYLYGTGGPDGIKVYMSKNMAAWTTAQGATDGYALHKNDVWGTKWFWAPEVYYVDDKFYMFYSAEERLAIAESDSPLGPFIQTGTDKQPIHTDIPEIDSHLFIDDDGKRYLYFVRFTNGNEIWCAELNEGMRSLKAGTLRHCIGATEAWETVMAKVAEGPFILKHKGLYYLTYSANHFQSSKYAVGYATSTSPLGPWVKYDKNPILIGNESLQGVGHHSFISTGGGHKYIVYHAHSAVGVVEPRKVCLDKYDFVPSPDGADKPDVIKVFGPTITEQDVTK